MHPSRSRRRLHPLRSHGCSPSVLSTPSFLQLAALLGVSLLLLSPGEAQPVFIPNVSISVPQSTLTAGTLSPQYIVAAEQGLSRSLELYAFDLSASLIYAVNSSGAVVVQSVGNPGVGAGTLLYFETRPHRGMLWVLAQQALLGFNATTLALLHQFSLATALTSPSNGTTTGVGYSGYLFLATDSQGRLFLTLSNQVYIISPTTGAQLGHFSVPNVDGLSSGTFDQGYYCAFDASDALWIIDGNRSAPNGSLPSYIVTSAGALLSSGLIDLPGAATEQLQSFAVDSAGFGYLSLYGDSLTSRAVFKVDPVTLKVVAQLQMPAAIIPPPTAGYDNEVSVSWGSTPQTDRLYAYDFQRLPIAVMSPSGASLLNVSTSPSGLVETRDNWKSLHYDSYEDSLLVIASGGLYTAVRVSASNILLNAYYVGVQSSGMPARGNAVDGDGAGYVALLGDDPTLGPLHNYLYFFHGTQLQWSVSVSLLFSPGYSFHGNVAIDGANSVIYTPTTNSNGTAAFAGYKYTGQLVRTLQAPLAYPSPYNLLFWRGLLLESSNALSNVIIAVNISTGAAYPFYTAPATWSITNFDISADGSVLYLVGTTTLSYQLAVAVRVSTGAILTQYNDSCGYRSPADITVSSAGLVTTADSTGLVSDISCGTGLLATFAAVQPSSSSAVGHPLFVGFLGQRYQVHGLDGAVYSILSSATTQLNARFVFLSSGGCAAVAEPGHCWTHAGSYFGSISVQNSAGARLQVAAGTVDRGFARVVLDGQDIGDRMGDHQSDRGAMTVIMVDAFHLTIHVGLWQFELDNSDRFINLAEARCSDRRLLRGSTEEQPHGLLGQTWQAKGRDERAHGECSGPRELAGCVDDYVERDSDLFGVNTLHNRFRGRTHSR